LLAPILARAEFNPTSVDAATSTAPGSRVSKFLPWR
jgi:hypothetical protein